MLSNSFYSVCELLSQYIGPNIIIATHNLSFDTLSLNKLAQLYNLGYLQLYDKYFIKIYDCIT